MGVSPAQLLIVLLIVALIFGTKRLRGLGEDLGAAIKGFKDANRDDKKALPNESQENIVNNEAKEQDKNSV